MTTPPSFITGQVLTAEVMNKTGLWVMKPTTATNGTVSNNQVIVGSAVSSVTINGVFNSDFSAYKIVARGVTCSADGSATLQLTASGTPLTANYYGALVFSNTTVQTAIDSASSGWSYIAANGAAVGLSLDVDIISPYKTETTSAANGSYIRNAFYGTYNGYNTSTSAYDGIKIFPQSGTFTGGTITVYGYNTGA